MAHIHTDSGQYDHTASAFIIRTDGPEPVVLLHMHRLLKQYLQFGGHVELNETPWQAVCHEIREESGYELSQLRLLQPKLRLKQDWTVGTLHPVSFAHVSMPFPSIDHNHSDLAYPFITSEDPLNQVGEGESNTIRAFTRAELAALPADQIPENVRKIALFALDQILREWEPVDPGEFSS